MSESLYGYKLAMNFNCKCKRAVLKCLKEHCCIHDESYYVCMQLDAITEQDLINGLNKLCSPEFGLTFAAKIYLNGQCEGNTILYEENGLYYESFDERKIVLKPLKDKLNRFKLLGPMSTNILANLLQTADSSSTEE